MVMIEESHNHIDVCKLEGLADNLIESSKGAIDNWKTTVGTKQKLAIEKDWLTETCISLCGELSTNDAKLKVADRIIEMANNNQLEP